jgi:hypothetical protein
MIDLERIGNWINEPYKTLREYPNGTIFLLKMITGQIHICQLTGNIDTDQSWKAHRYSDRKTIRLENFKKAKAVILLSPKKEEL